MRTSDRAAETCPRAVVPRLPALPGVYRLRDARGRALYVGRASNLRRRVASYWGDLGDRPHLTRMVDRIARVEAVACDSEHEAAWLERTLLERAMPYWNRVVGGAEVPLYIRLTGHGRVPELTVVDTPEHGGDARHFGPYLGGRKVRMAVSALHRMLPLRYAVDRLDGTAGELARALGVEPSDRTAYVETIATFLRRDPRVVASVCAELERRRDGAARTLAFEYAARLQAELRALTWIVSEQKVASCEPLDLAVAGWSDGVLVRFEVEAGRLRVWRQRSCSEAAARPHLAATPAGWVSFAQRNAELAARLRAP